MRVPASLGLVVALGACEARISGVPQDPPDAGLGLDAAPPSIDAPPAMTLGPWATPVKISAAAGTGGEDDVTLSSNTLELFFSLGGSNGNGKDLYYATRPTVDGAWTTATRLPFNNATTSDETPRLSGDDKTLYFASGRAGNGDLDIYRVTRQAAGSTTWSSPQPLAQVNTANGEKWFMRCGSDRYLMVQDTAAGSFDLVEGTLGGPPPTPIAELNSTDDETGTFVTQDCRTVYFASPRLGTNAIYRATRESLTTRWSDPAAVVDFAATGGDQEDPWLSADERTFAFASNAAGGKDLYLTTRTVTTAP